MNTNDLKRLAAEKAVEEIKDGMVIGLGTGSTFQFALEKIAKRINTGDLKNIIGVCSSERTRLEATRLGVPLTTLNELYKRNSANPSFPPNASTGNNSCACIPSGQFPIDITIDGADEAAQGLPERSEGSIIKLIDLTIDGADEVDQQLNLIKGGGGALLGEKIIVQATKKFVVIVDEGKLSKVLGTNFAVPIEVLKKAEEPEKKYLELLGAVIVKRFTKDRQEYITDEGNIILDAKFKCIQDVKGLSSMLSARAGIVEHGIFGKELVAKVISAMNDGTIKEWNTDQL
jgi:ribose 5-phosphate isomerase A